LPFFLPDRTRYSYRAMCAWERFCAFAREPEHRKVGVDAAIDSGNLVVLSGVIGAGETASMAQ
jgi:hypothetical protein